MAFQWQLASLGLPYTSPPQYAPPGLGHRQLNALSLSQIPNRYANVRSQLNGISNWQMGAAELAHPLSVQNYHNTWHNAGQGVAHLSGLHGGIPGGMGLRQGFRQNYRYGGLSSSGI